ncbi:hypothetical protein LWI29_007300 [Acer saccharum]|uniref:Retrotransposon Copia-like N-terminal domain-containing protein n=1 Tax=Acer saccharum TaxID=4024 RepID=A0AA39VSQ4_ACESA|nr:hypothetical protein LWI29_007300 [Acer saccharum]
MTDTSKPITSAHAIHVENPTLRLTTSKFDGKNFMEWSQFVKISLKGKGKFKYISGAAEPPDEKDPKYESWDTKNYMVV